MTLSPSRKFNFVWVFVESGTARAPERRQPWDPSPHWLHSMSLIHSLDGPGSEGVAACDGHKKNPAFIDKAGCKQTPKRRIRAPCYLAAAPTEKSKTGECHQAEAGRLRHNIKGSPECSGSPDHKACADSIYRGGHWIPGGPGRTEPGAEE